MTQQGEAGEKSEERSRKSGKKSEIRMIQQKGGRDMRGKTENGAVQKDREAEQIQKERIRTFDRKLLEEDADRAMASKILYMVMGSIGCFLMLLPFNPDGDPDLRVIHVLAWLFLGMAVIFRIQPYVYIVGDTSRVSAVLAYIPVDKALLRRVRREYLRHYLFWLGAVCFVLQQFGAFMNGAWSVWSLIYPAGTILFLYLAGTAYIG